MKARNPRIDFTGSLPHWSKHREFAQMTNGGSIVLPYLEPFLNKVMLRASEKLAGHGQLQTDIALFVAQEGQHYRQHRLFNKILLQHYPALAALEAEMKSEYERFLRTKSLKFCCAYAEGFEAQGVVYGRFLFEAIDDLLNESDSNVVRLWQWHMAEEYEHRTVSHDVYGALFGGYFSRIYGLFYSLRHLNGFAWRGGTIMLDEDRKAMTPAQVRASKAREKAFRRRQTRFFLRHLLRVLSPFYDPRKRPEPRGAAAVLREVDAVAA